MIRTTIHRLVLVLAASIATGLLGISIVCAQTAAGKVASPAGVLCKDGTVSARGGRGACSRHGGIASGGVKEKSSPTARDKAKERAREKTHAALKRERRATTSAEAGAAGATAGARLPAVRGRPVPETSGSAAPIVSHADQVWVNLNTKVYHCPGDRWYGKTKVGRYLSESEAIAQGYRPDHGKECH